jgi:hypothetical protein
MRHCVIGFVAIVLGVMVLLPAERSAADGPGQAIDLTKAKELYERQQKGEKLSADEQVYLNNARQVRAQRQQRGPASQPAQLTPKPTMGLTPLTEMAADDTYKGEDGGLYGGGSNEPPKLHQAAAVAESAKIRPLDETGKPADGGRIVLLSMGMSNTTQEFSKFKELADADAAKSPAVTIVDGAQGGKAALQWNGPSGANVWAEVDRRLKAAGVTAEQVQVVFIKQALITPAQYGEFPGHARELEKQLIGNLQLARNRFANLKVAYLTSRIYGGYARGMLNPEPFAYEGAFAVRWVIADQIKGDRPLNFDPRKGEVKSPLLLWGPYLWADGVTPRKSDQLAYQQEDLGPDGTHPSAGQGRKKVAELLLKFFTTDPLAKGWFTRSAAGGSDKPADTTPPTGGATTVPPL